MSQKITTPTRQTLLQAHRSGWSQTFETRKPVQYLPSRGESIEKEQHKAQVTPPQHLNCDEDDDDEVFSRSSSIDEASLLFRIGVVADCQHADKEDVKEGGRTRYYRGAVTKLSRAVNAFIKENQMNCVIQLGDCIDGNVNESKTKEDLERIAVQLDRLNDEGEAIPCHSVLGNHCLSLSRDTILKRLQMPASYYACPLTTNQDEVKWKLVVCDSNDLSLNWPHNHPKRIQAEAFLDHVKKTCFCPHPQLTRWNGGFSNQQLEWLEAQFEDARHHNVNILLAAHHPLSTSAARQSHCAWNLFQIQTLLFKYNDVIRVVLAGHDHLGGYAFHHGIHFVTIEAMLEAPKNAYAILDIYPHGLGVRGSGSVTSQFLPFRRYTHNTYPSSRRKPLRRKLDFGDGTLLADDGEHEDDDLTPGGLDDETDDDNCTAGGLDDDDDDDFDEDDNNIVDDDDDFYDYPYILKRTTTTASVVSPSPSQEKY